MSEVARPPSLTLSFRQTETALKVVNALAWAPYKEAYRKEHHLRIAWYLVAVTLGAFISVKHEEIFATAVFFTLGAYYACQQGRLESWWKATVQAGLLRQLEGECKLEVSDQGLIEQRYNGQPQRQHSSCE
jgi:hypothetical protein